MRNFYVIRIVVVVVSGTTTTNSGRRKKKEETREKKSSNENEQLVGLPLQTAIIFKKIMLEFSIIQMLSFYA